MTPLEMVFLARARRLLRRERFQLDCGDSKPDLSDYTADLGGEATELVCFSMIFGYSRWQYIRFTERANTHSVSHSHVFGDYGECFRHLN
jgi:hypothetical protein